MYCQIGVGRAHVMDEVTAESSPIPEGYDSFYLKGTNTAFVNK